MSTGCNCLFLQVEPQKWYYVLEDSSAPKNAWDWRENSTAYGPFSTEDLADQHLRDNHANPGGAEFPPLPDGVLKLNLEKDPTLKELIEKATPARRNNRYSRRW